MAERKILISQNFRNTIEVDWESPNFPPTMEVDRGDPKNPTLRPHLQTLFHSHVLQDQALYSPNETAHRAPTPAVEYSTSSSESGHGYETDCTLCCDDPQCQANNYPDDTRMQSTPVRIEVAIQLVLSRVRPRQGEIKTYRFVPYDRQTRKNRLRSHMQKGVRDCEQGEN